jgi:glutamine synthetase
MVGEGEVIEKCTDGDVDLVRLLHVDNAGVVRGRVVDGDDIKDVLESGTNMAKVMQSFTSMNRPAPEGPFGAVGEARLIPDPETFRELPYADRTAVMLVDKYTGVGVPAVALDRVLVDEFEYTPSTAFESEFYLLRETDDGPEPIDESGCFTADGMQSAHEVVLDMVEAIEAQGMSLEVYYPEYGPGQQELVVDHDRGLLAPDNQVLYKQTVKAVAAAHDLKATFSPKPLSGGPGSGCHVHVSLWDGDSNVFSDPDADSAYGISDTCRHFIGGVLEHAPALVALTAPTVVSYKRLQPHAWASAFTAWGFDNREAVVRVPSSQWEDRAKTTRFEFKAADNTSNPYLALLGLLAAGRDGIEREFDPGEPVTVDPASLSADERSERGIERLPETLGEAIAELEADEVLADAMGETLFEAFVSSRRAEWTEATTTANDWDVETYTRQF